MPKFNVTGTVTVSCHTVVEADSAEEAREIADSRDLAGLCFQPFSDGEEEAWHIEADGTPDIQEVEEQ